MEKIKNNERFMKFLDIVNNRRESLDLKTYLLNLKRDIEGLSDRDSKKRDEVLQYISTLLSSSYDSHYIDSVRQYTEDFSVFSSYEIRNAISGNTTKRFKFPTKAIGQRDEYEDCKKICGLINEEFNRSINTEQLVRTLENSLKYGKLSAIKLDIESMYILYKYLENLKEKLKINTAKDSMEK